MTETKKPSNSPRLRSIEDNENYATYLGLPLLELNKGNFYKDNFINSYFTVNGQIAVLVKSLDFGWNPEEHKQFRGYVTVPEGILIIFKCPDYFVTDMIYLLSSKYSKLSDMALSYIKTYSGMHIDVPSKGKLYTHPLVANIRQDLKARERLNKILGVDLPPDAELEPLLREQDILYDIDTDISFVYDEYKPKKKKPKSL